MFGHHVLVVFFVVVLALGESLLVEGGIILTKLLSKTSKSGFSRETSAFNKLRFLRIGVLSDLRFIIKGHAFSKSLHIFHSLEFRILEERALPNRFVSSTLHITFIKSLTNTFLEEAELLDTHFISGQGSGFIRTNDSCASKSLNTRKRTNNSILLSHLSSTKS